MQSIRLHGKVLPEVFQVGLPASPTIHWECEGVGTLQFECQIEKSIVSVECTNAELRLEHFPEVYRRALDLCRAQVDLVAFKMGWGLTVLLESFTAPDGKTYPIAPTQENLANICTAFSLSSGFDEVWRHVIQTPLLFMALRELVSSITLPHVSSVECARAMDRLKHLVASPDSSDKVAWAELRQALQVGETYLKFITDHSANSRHGRPGHTPGSITTEVTRRAWVIMNRYLEYLKRGSKALQVAEFPLLTEVRHGPAT